MKGQWVRRLDVLTSDGSGSQQAKKRRLESGEEGDAGNVLEFFGLGEEDRKEGRAFRDRFQDTCGMTGGDIIEKEVNAKRQPLVCADSEHQPG